MFQNKRHDELKLLYSVFKRDQSTFSLVINIMSPYVTERGRKITQDEEMIKNPILYTQSLLDFKAEIN